MVRSERERGCNKCRGCEFKQWLEPRKMNYRGVNKGKIGGMEGKIASVGRKVGRARVRESSEQ